MVTMAKSRPAIMVVAAAIILTTGHLAFASISGAPSHEVLSGNGVHKVNVTARVVDGKVESRMSLSAKRDNDWLEVWTFVFREGTHPAMVFVDNHGRVVTAGNSLAGTPDADHELVLYRDGKVFQRFSRDELLRKYGEAETAKFATGTRVVSIPPSWYGDSSYSCFDPEDRFCIWDDAARSWILVDLTDGSLVTADEQRQQYYVEQARKDAYAKIKEKNGKYCHDYYYRLARFLRPEDKPVFEKLLTVPFADVTGYSSGPGDIYFFAANRYRELAEWVLDALENGEQDAIADSRRFARHEAYRHLGSLTFNATFQQPPTSNDGVVVVWLEPAGRVDAEANGRPDHALGIDLRFKIHKPLAMPTRIHLYGITPGRYRARGYWNKDIEQFYKIKDDFWKRTGEFTIADTPVVIEEGKAVGVDVSFVNGR